MDLKDMTELTDEELNLVVGGSRYTVNNDKAVNVIIRSGPGKNYDAEYSVHNGDTVYTVGCSVEIDGCCWYQLDDGNWIQGDFLKN